MNSEQEKNWERVNSIKRKVQAALGARPKDDIHSSELYQAYTALCGEAFYAHKESALDAELLSMLEEKAERLIAQHKR